MRKQFSMIFSLILVLCLLLPAWTIAEEAAVYQCELLQQAIANDSGTDKSIGVYVTFKDPLDYESVLAETQQEVQGEINQQLGETYEYAPLSDFSPHQIAKERYVAKMMETATQRSERLLNELGIPTDRITKVHFAQAVIPAWYGFYGTVTPAEAAWLADCEQITTDYWSEDGEKCNCLGKVIGPDDPCHFSFTIGVFEAGETTLTYAYTAADALNILKNAVGKEYTQPEGVPRWVYDVNDDGITDATDALWALQHSVGNRRVSFPQSYLAK